MREGCFARLTHPSTATYNDTYNFGETQVVAVKELAEGGFGTVYLVHDHSTARTSNNNNQSTATNYYAMKKMLLQTKEQIIEAQEELKCLQLFAHNSPQNHPHIIDLLASNYYNPASEYKSTNNVKTHKELLLLFPYYAKGTVYDIIQNASPETGVEGLPWLLNESWCIHILLGISSALSHIHGLGYAHWDVKPRNILLGK